MPVELQMEGEREDDADAEAGDAAEERHDAIKVREEDGEDDEGGDDGGAEEEAEGRGGGWGGGGGVGGAGLGGVGVGWWYGVRWRICDLAGIEAEEEFEGGVDGASSVRCKVWV